MKFATGDEIVIINYLRSGPAKILGHWTIHSLFEYHGAISVYAEKSKRQWHLGVGVVDEKRRESSFVIFPQAHTATIADFVERMKGMAYGVAPVDTPEGELMKPGYVGMAIGNSDWGCPQIYLAGPAGETIRPLGRDQHEAKNIRMIDWFQELQYAGKLRAAPDIPLDRIIEESGVPTLAQAQAAAVTAAEEIIAPVDADSLPE